MTSPRLRRHYPGTGTDEKEFKIQTTLEGLAETGFKSLYGGKGHTAANANIICKELKFTKAVHWPVMSLLETCDSAQYFSCSISSRAVKKTGLIMILFSYYK